MMVDGGYADDLKHELLTEMAENFFSRRRRLDERLEAFAAMRERVARRGMPCLARWRTFRALLLGGEAADRFLTKLGFDVDRLRALATATGQIGSGVPLALTEAGRYRKAVRRCYETLRRELVDYNEGGYAPDPREPRRMRRIPGFDHLLAEGRSLNEEIAAVNAGQCPSDMLQFTKSLDPVRQEQEHACGGHGTCGCGLDRELAYTPLDLDGLDVPALPTPPPLEAVADELSALAKQLYAGQPQAARTALETLAKG
jgi:hypothetical protein